VSLKKYSHEDIIKMSMIELANLVLSEKGKAVPFKELFDEVADVKEFTDDQRGTYIAQLYTDLNVDGRFVNMGSNTWGLKRWYPVNQVMEETKAAPKKKMKKKPVKKKPEIKEDEEADNLDSDGDLEELTADFSKLDGKDDIDEEVEDLDIFAEELEMDAEYDDELDDDLDEEEDEFEEEGEEFPKENH